MWKVILAIIGALIVIALAFLYYVGFFTKVVVEEKQMGPYVLVYEEHRGAYKDIAIVMDKVYNSLLNEDKIQTVRGMGIYYNNPQETPEADLRSIGGSLIEGKDLDQLPSLEKKYKVMRIEESKSIVVEFPYKNQFSIIAGVVRVYPVMSKYITDHNYQPKEMVEIYDLPNGKIQYIMGL